MPAEKTFDEKTFERVIVEEIAGELTRAAIHFKGLAQKNSPTGATGNLGNSYTVRDPEIDASMFGVAVSIGAQVNYGAYVEFPTRPHWPPLRPIYQYIDALVSQGRIDVTVGNRSSASEARRRRYLPRSFSRARQVFRVARAIQRKIASQGTEGQYMMREALREMGITNYNVATIGGEIVYEPDIAQFLQRQEPAIWDRIAARMKKI